MLGAGCHMRDKCPKYKTATKWHKEQYCDHPKGCDQCGERPMNWNKQDVQDNYKAANEGAGIGAFIVLGFIIFIALKIFGVI